MNSPACPVSPRPTGRPRKYSPDEFRHLYTAHYANMTHAAAAAELGITECTFSRYVAELRGPEACHDKGRPAVFSADEFSRLYAEKCSGLPYATAARVLGVSVTTYKRYMREMRKARAVN